MHAPLAMRDLVDIDGHRNPRAIPSERVELGLGKFAEIEDVDRRK
jgi:hypothetical protein